MVSEKVAKKLYDAAAPLGLLPVVKGWLSSAVSIQIDSKFVNAVYSDNSIGIPDYLEGKALLGALAHEMDHHYNDSFYTNAMRDAYRSNNYDQAFQLTVASEARAVVAEAELGLKYYSGHKLGYALDYSRYFELKNVVFLRYIGMGVAAPYVREDFWDDVRSEVQTYLSVGVAGNVIRSQVTRFLGRPGAQREVGVFLGGNSHTAPLFDPVTQARMDDLAYRIFGADGHGAATQRVSVAIFDAGKEVGRTEIVRFVPHDGDPGVAVKEVGEFIQGLNDRNSSGQLSATLDRYSGLVSKGGGGWQTWSGTIWGGGPGRREYSPEPIDMPWQPLSTGLPNTGGQAFLSSEVAVMEERGVDLAAARLIQASAGFVMPGSSSRQISPFAQESPLLAASL